MMCHGIDFEWYSGGHRCPDLYRGRNLPAGAKFKLDEIETVSHNHKSIWEATFSYKHFIYGREIVQESTDEGTSVAMVVSVWEFYARTQYPLGGITGLPAPPKARFVTNDGDVDISTRGSVLSFYHRTADVCLISSNLDDVCRPRFRLLWGNIGCSLEGDSLDGIRSKFDCQMKYSFAGPEKTRGLDEIMAL